jgi:hypothetical protein
MRHTTRRTHLLPLALLLGGAGLLGACASLPVAPAPEIIIPPGVVSTQTADQVARRMLDEIAANERKLGRALATARIIRIQLLRPGEMYELRHLDGTNPDGTGMSPDGGPGWMVEAIGTFVGEDFRTGQIEARGTHGFHLWDDAGGESLGFIPCWSVHQMPPEAMEGSCP